MACRRAALQTTRLLTSQLVRRVIAESCSTSDLAIQARIALTGGAPALLAGSRGFAASAANASRSAPVSYLSLLLTLATGGGIVYYFDHERKKKVEAARVKTATVGRTAVGGPFQLVDQDGKPFTDKDLLGKWALIYFGFTYCPDICPDELEKVAAAVDLLEETIGEKVQPVFISIDPERDTVAQVKSYVKEFHPRIIGLTGTLEQVKDAARAYRVYYSKTDDSTDYLVDHSIIHYLLNPHGEFVTFYGKNYEAPAMADSIAKHIGEFSG